MPLGLLKLLKVFRHLLIFIAFKACQALPGFMALKVVSFFAVVPKTLSYPAISCWTLHAGSGPRPPYKALVSFIEIIYGPTPYKAIKSFFRGLGPYQAVKGYMGVGPIRTYVLLFSAFPHFIHCKQVIVFFILSLCQVNSWIAIGGYHATSYWHYFCTVSGHGSVNCLMTCDISFWWYW